jgi:hypothetical protein
MAASASKQRQQQKKTQLQQLAPSEQARTHLRDSLLAYLRASYAADDAVPSMPPYERWDAPEPPRPAAPPSTTTQKRTSVLIGDAASLMVLL